MARTQRSIFAAVALFFTAPFVAEFLLGNLSVKALPALVALAPMYGGGALLIRELVRRSGRGWPAILLLGAAYTLIEEGFVTQSLFNPDYLRMQMHLLDHAWIPGLRISAWWTLFMFNLHTFWSISVSIALVEGLVPTRAQQPWLGRIGDSIVGVLFLIGCAIVTGITLKKDPFISSASHFLGAGVLCLVLIVLAFRTRVPHPGRPLLATGWAAANVSTQARFGSPPSPWLTGLVTFLLGFAILITPNAWNWGAFAIQLAIDVVFLLSVAVLSNRAAWTPLHTLSLGAGGAFAYGIHAFIEIPVFGGTGLTARVGNIIFLAIAAAIIAAGAMRTSRWLKTASSRNVTPLETTRA